MEYQLLSDHLNNTAKLAAEFAKKIEIGVEQLGYYAGLWHDIGKSNPEFQSYLQDHNARRGPDHSSAGAVFSIQSCDLLSAPLAGHHSGLADLSNLQQRMKKKRSDNKIVQAIDFAQKNFNIKPATDILNFLPDWLTNRLHQELFIRMIFSCLVDADYSDTESFCDPDKSRARKSINSTIPALETVFTKFYTNMNLTADPNRLNEIRYEIYNHCLQMAANQPGIYRLTVPTGGGKTLASMGFALRHAVLHGLNRVIVAIPYTSIIEQTADVYQEIFGMDNVLEHHSALDVDTENVKSTIRLAADNWDTSVIVTTTVQLLESLFSNRPSKCRKIHNIANSVIILDEVQTLPLNLLAPILSVLQELVDYYQVTVVLCTATQPALDGSPYLKGLSNIREIIPEPELYFPLLKRVEYRIQSRAEKWSWQDVATEMMQHEQCLVIVNTKGDARKLLEALQGHEVMHLSTLMCGAHRRATLAEVKQRLKDGKPCRLVSTQVVEAGVDLDFPVVMRAVAPLDRIVQAAGRCNREGKLQDNLGHLVPGQVIIFEPEEGGLPRGSYRSATDQARNTLSVHDIDLHDPALYRKYFKSLYQLVDTDSKSIQKIREKLQFEEVSKEFKMIEEETVPVLVGYADAFEKIERFKEQIKFGHINRQLIRKLQPYLVSVYKNQINRLMNESLITELAEGIYEWNGIYNSVSGIVEKSYDPESLCS